MNLILITLSIKYYGNWDLIFKALENREKVNFRELKIVESFLKRSPYKVITILDEEYPEEFKNIFKPPFCLWLKGELKNLKKYKICLSGNYVNDSVKSKIEDFLPQIINDYTFIIPGFAGADQLLIKKSWKPNLHILPCGLDYWNKEKEKDVIMTEYPPQTKPEKINFKNRNCLIAGFSNVLVLFSSFKNGKINSHINEFLNLGKEVFAFPDNGSKEDGNSFLIKQGANLITEANDIKS